MKSKILLVEDNRDHQKIISRYLSDYEVEIASCGSTGLEALLKADFELIVVDYNLGDMNGIDFARLVRGQNIPTPILMISSHENIELEIKAVHSGSNFFISKSRFWKNHNALSEAVSAIIREAARQSGKGKTEAGGSKPAQNAGEFMVEDWIRLLRNAHESLAILNQNEEIIFWNEKAIEMFGLPQFRGQTLPMDRLMSIENTRRIRKEISSVSDGECNSKGSREEFTMEFAEKNLKLRIISIKGVSGKSYSLFVGTYLVENKRRMAEMSDVMNL